MFDSQIMDLWDWICTMLRASYYDLTISSRFVFSKLNNSIVSTSPWKANLEILQTHYFPTYLVGKQAQHAL